MKTIDLAQLSPIDIQQWLQYAIAPRPVCFASTIDKQGRINLSPFSFFNLISTNPAIVVFSPSRRVRDNTTKHTLQNVMEVPEVVINMVDYAMVQQTSLASCDYSKDDNEFIKAGFTMQPATMVTPPMVLESKIKMECRVTEIKSMGDEGGAGQLVFARVLKMHIEESVLGDDGKIDQLKMQHVARLGGDWYCRVDAHNLFKVPKPNAHTGMGIDALPEAIRNSKWLSGNNLAMLANVQQQPGVDPAFSDERVKNIFQYFSLTPDDLEAEIHVYAKELLDAAEVNKAWQVLMAV